MRYVLPAIWRLIDALPLLLLLAVVVLLGTGYAHAAPYCPSWSRLPDCRRVPPGYREFHRYDPVQREQLEYRRRWPQLDLVPVLPHRCDDGVIVNGKAYCRN